ncbi:MAG: transketolase family protein [Candidatus Loosdrechtia sp.]|uniref:transketolase family protein n=1 Tax=Candidatus Loosdrechtia sp. TaxID=3101272 RepID=UPI003A6C2BE8|nr:MAG: transketolase family protein [Candidatus Jettenia sp. AMX2]
MTEMIATRQAYGEALVELGEKNKDIVVLDADLSKSTTTAKFCKKFPDRFFNMGVAEANMINTAAGLATCGKIAFVSSFSIFATGRAWEQIRNTVCYSRLNVKIVATHSGVSVGPDGASHQCVEDISLMQVIPTMTVIEPCDAIETGKAIHAAVDFQGPVYIRLGRAAVPVITKKDDPFIIGKANVLREGKDVAIIACGALIANSLSAAEALSKEGIDAAVVNMHTIKPADQETILRVARQVNAVVTAEQHVLDGGLGSTVASVLSRNYPVPVEMIGIHNRFGQSGEPDTLFKEYHLLPEDIISAAKRVIGRKKR